jgi:hypothetical protein
MALRIGSIVTRADRAESAGCALDSVDLRGWHYVLGAGMLGHLSPHGFDEGMHGRYAWVQDTLAMVKMGLERLRVVLRAWGIEPPCVYAPPGRDHEVLGEAAARVLGLELAPWPSVGVPAPGLVVVYDLANVERKDLERLLERREGQVLYAHATGWTEDGAIAPDMTTVLHQSIVSPWEPQLVIDPKTGEAKTGEADIRTAEELGAAVAAAADMRDEDTARDDVEGLVRLAKVAGAPEPGRRERAWAGGPVGSNRFL